MESSDWGGERPEAAAFGVGTRQRSAVGGLGCPMGLTRRDTKTLSPGSSITVVMGPGSWARQVGDSNLPNVYATKPIPLWGFV